MAVLRLRDGSLLVHSPVELDDALAEALARLGPVRHIVSPNYEHVKYAAQARPSYTAGSQPQASQPPGMFCPDPPATRAPHAQLQRSGLVQIPHAIPGLLVCPASVPNPATDRGPAGRRHTHI